MHLGSRPPLWPRPCRGPRASVREAHVTPGLSPGFGWPMAGSRAPGRRSALGARPRVTGHSGACQWAAQWGGCGRQEPSRLVLQMISFLTVGAQAPERYYAVDGAQCGLTLWTLSPGREFPSSFESLVKKICKYLFHVLAHIYWSHFKETLALELHGHLNTLYVHFILFAREFNLLDSKDTAVMDDLTEVLCSGGGRGGGGGEGASGGGAGAQNHGKER